MLKRFFPIAIAGIAIMGATACKNKDGGFKTTKDGLEYNIVKDEPGTQYPKIGDIIEFHLTTRIGDSVVFDSRKNGGQAMQFPLAPSNKKGDVVDGVMMMTPGDSAIFRVAIDSTMRNQMIPWAKPGDKIQYNIVLISVKTKEQADKEGMEKASAQKKIDEQLLSEYLTKNNIAAEKTASGLAYKITAPGAGETAKTGQAVTVNYTGKTLDGKVFDSNLDPQFQHVEPLTVTLGQGQVIPGWEEGIALLKKGSKATLYIPSTLAYGEKSPNPNIPANAILVFDVEIKDIK